MTRLPADEPTIDEQIEAAEAHWMTPAMAGHVVASLRRLRERESFDFHAHLQRQRDWSSKTFGPDARAQGVVDHIRKELNEVLAKPDDLSEWIDVTILALDGAWRAGYSPDAIIGALVAKQTRNEARVWPDWRTADPNKAIEHDRTTDASPPAAPGCATVAELESALRDKLQDAQHEVPPSPDTQRGLYSKYYVMRLNDTTGKHKDCEYYVLDLTHDRFAEQALFAYAEACEKEFPQLASDLRAKAWRIKEMLSAREVK